MSSISAINIILRHKILTVRRSKLSLKHGIKRNIHKSSTRESDTHTSLQNICPGNTKYKMDVSCKAAFVTGGTSGIGLAIANQLLCSGARSVAITGNDVCKGKDAATLLNNNHGMGKAIFIQSNVNCMAQFEDSFRAAADAFKRLDIVVNAAGVCDGAQWEREIVTNIIGTIRGTLLAYRYIGKEGLGKGGVVINVGGVNGLQPFPAAPTLCASQHAIVGLSRSFGNKIHSEKSGIRVACLCPGFTKTSFIKNLSGKGMTDKLGKELETAVNKAKKQKPDPCGHAVVHMIRHATNGSVWLCEGSRLFMLRMPNTKSYKTLVAQYL